MPCWVSFQVTFVSDYHYGSKADIVAVYWSNTMHAMLGSQFEFLLQFVQLLSKCDSFPYLASELYKIINATAMLIK